MADDYLLHNYYWINLYDVTPFVYKMTSLFVYKQFPCVTMISSLNFDSSLLEALNDPSLSHQLTSTNLVDRQKALESLIQCMKSHESKISTLELNALIDFFASKCQKDHHSLYPHVIEAYSWLLVHPQTDAQSVVGALRVFFNEIQVQSQVRGDRIRIFKMLNQIVKSQDLALKERMNQEFVMGYLLAVEGETDPEALLSIFNTWPIIMDSFDVQHLVEDIFEVISCYFPIDLRGHEENSPKTQLEHTLRLSLRYALTSNIQFAPLTLSFLIEKSQTNLKHTTTECIQTLMAMITNNACPPAPSVLRPHLASLWKNLIHVQPPNLELLAAICNFTYPSFEVYEELFYNNICPDLKRDLLKTNLEDSALEVLKILTHNPMDACPVILEVFLPEFKEALIENKLHLIGGLFTAHCNVEPIKSKVIDCLSTDKAPMAIQSLINGALNLFENDMELLNKIVEGLIYKYPTWNMAKLLSIMNFEMDRLRKRSQQLDIDKRVFFIECLVTENDASFCPLLSLITDELGHNCVMESLVRLCKSSTNTRDYLRKEFLNHLIQMQSPNLELISLLVNEDFLLKNSNQIIENSAILEALWGGVDPVQIPLTSQPIYQKLMTENQNDEHLIRLKFSFINKVNVPFEESFAGKSIIYEAWMLKGLLLKGSLTKIQLESLLSKVQPENAVQIFEILTQDYLKFYKHLQISTLYRQKLYCWSVDYLLDKKYLGALMVQILSLPIFVYSANLPKIFALMNEEETGLTLQSGLELAQILLQNKEEELNKKWIENMITFALKDKSVHNRLLALKCLKMLHPEGDLSVLNRALMDPKRIVRKAAVEVKNALMIANN